MTVPWCLRSVIAANPETLPESNLFRHERGPEQRLHE